MFRFLSPLILMIAFMLPVFAQADTALSRAMEAVRSSDWEAAERQVRRSEIGQDIVEWHRLRAGVGTAKETMAFLERRPSWPGLPLLRRKQEAAFVDQSADRVLRFFADEGAQTAVGALILADALRSKGRKGEAESEIVLAWRTLAMDAPATSLIPA